MHASRPAGAIDAPRVADETPKYAARQQTEQDREMARNKLLALAGNLADRGLRTRPLEARPDRIGRRPVRRLCAFVLVRGWRFHAHPTGSVIASAEGVEQPGDPASREVAVKVAKRVATES